MVLTVAPTSVLPAATALDRIHAHATADTPEMGRRAQVLLVAETTYVTLQL